LRVSDSLWQTNTGEQIVSLLYAQFNPDTGEGRIASAGKIHAIIAGERGFRPVCSGAQSDPLGSSIDGRYADAEFRLQPGEVLVAVNDAVLDQETGLTQADWADCVRNAISLQDVPVLPAIRRGLAGKSTTKERAGVMLMRRK
jgi:sigma-B regulation protein RsbU (phosphoserine phosphatase)